MGRSRGAGSPVSNRLVGIFLLIVLAVFAGPNALPRLLSSVFPDADEGVPCVWLPVVDSEGQHQSYIGRMVSQTESPLSIRIDPGTLPNNAEEVLTVRAVLTNETIGTVAIVVLPDGQVSTLGDTLPGIGIAFNPQGTIPPAQSAATPDTIRQLAPRQRCVVRLEFSFDQIAQAGINPASTVQAYYRNPSNVPIQVPDAAFTDYGLWSGVIGSEVASMRFVTAAP